MTCTITVDSEDLKFFQEDYEHDNCYSMLRDEIWEWLNEHDPDWDMDDKESDVVFQFSKPAVALLFKLTWGGA